MLTIANIGALHAACFYVAALIIGAALLALNVVRERRRCGMGLGSSGDPKLERAIRMHGNYTENVPFGIGALILLPLVGATAWLVHFIGLALLVGRLAHAQGLAASGGASGGRVIGMILTLGAPSPPRSPYCSALSPRGAILQLRHMAT